MLKKEKKERQTAPKQKHQKQNEPKTGPQVSTCRMAVTLNGYLLHCLEHRSPHRGYGALGSVFTRYPHKPIFHWLVSAPSFPITTSGLVGICVGVFYDSCFTNNLTSPPLPPAASCKHWSPCPGPVWCPAAPGTRPAAAASGLGSQWYPDLCPPAVASSGRAHVTEPPQVPAPWPRLPTADSERRHTKVAQLHFHHCFVLDSEIHLMDNNPLSRCERKYLFLQLAQLAWQALHSDPGLLQLFMGSSHQVAVPVSWLTGIFQLTGREKRQSAHSRAQLQQKNYTASVWPS